MPSFYFHLIVAALRLELYASAGHHASSKHVAVELFLIDYVHDDFLGQCLFLHLFAEPKHIEGILRVLQLFVIIDGVHLGFALRDVDVVVDVVRQPALPLQGLGADLVSVFLEQLVEDVVGPLHLLLEGDPGLLQEVGLYVTSSQLPFYVKMNPDEFALKNIELQD